VKNIIVDNDILLIVRPSVLLLFEFKYHVINIKTPDFLFLGTIFSPTNHSFSLQHADWSNKSESRKLIESYNIR